MPEYINNKTSAAREPEYFEECMRRYAALKEKVREYLQYASVDGRTIRQKLRRELSDLVDVSNNSKTAGERDDIHGY